MKFFDEVNSHKFFDNRENIIIFLTSDIDVHHNEYLQIFQEFAIKNAGGPSYYFGHLGKGMGLKMAEFIGIRQNHGHHVFALEFRGNDDILKYQMKEHIGVRNLELFLRNFKNRNLKRFIKSQPIPLHQG